MLRPARYVLGAAAAGLLLSDSDLGLENRSTVDVVDSLDATHTDRERGLTVSVTADEKILQHSWQREVLEVAKDGFHLGVPFEAVTHDCFHHSLSGWQGELVDPRARDRRGRERSGPTG